MKYYQLLGMFFAATMLGACSGDDAENVSMPDNGVAFTPTLKAMTRATETAFEVGDQVSIYAVEATGNQPVTLLNSGNYADNILYTFDGSRFVGGNNAIVINKEQPQNLAYYAIYPYQSTTGNAFSFTVKADQSTHADYTASDLCTAYAEPSTSNNVTLVFLHRLTNIVVNCVGDNLGSKTISVKLNNVLQTAQADLNANTFTGIGNTGNVLCYEESTNSYEGIIAPQTINKGAQFMTITMNGTDYPITMAETMTFKSGKQYIYTLEFNDNEFVVLSGYILPWDSEDMRMDNVVPPEILEEIEDYMPIYQGVNPPNVEGAYLIEPQVLVYSSDHNFEPGHVFTSNVLRFFDQNTNNNTLSVADRSLNGSSYSQGSGAYICGTGDNFTAFFNTEGTSHGIYTKMADVYSGTMSSSGIVNLYHAFVMVEKGDDPNHMLMGEGVYRIVTDSDGLSVKTRWENSRAKDRWINSELNTIVSNMLSLSY